MTKTKIQTHQVKPQSPAPVVQKKRNSNGRLPVARKAIPAAAMGPGPGAAGRAQMAASLQRQVGNARLSRLEGAPVQARLQVGPVGDKYEQEADRVARQVTDQTPASGPGGGVEEEEQLRMQPAAGAPGQEEEEETARRQPATEATEEEEETARMQPATEATEEEAETARLQPAAQSPGSQEEENQLQMQPAAGAPGQEEEKQPVQMKPQSAPAGNAVTPDMEANIQQARRGGQPMSENIRASMEQKFGADFSGVKLHTDDRADRLNRSLNARAFTTGQNVFFKQGEYNPGSSKGQELLAHELTHVVQQGGQKQTGQASKAQRKVLLNRPGPAGGTWRELTRRQRRRFLRRYFRARRSRQRRLAERIIDDMARSADEFKFSNEEELRDELIKRVTTSFQMQASQQMVEGKSAFGYPFTGSSLYWGPRVNYAARDYWQPAVVDDYSRRQDSAKRQRIKELPRRERYTVYGDPAPGYSWSLTDAGKADPYEAIMNLFVKQSPHKRTLLHCDYLVSLVHYQSFAAAVGKREFNRRLQAFGVDKIILKATAFQDLQLETVVGGSRRPGLGSLQAVRPASPDDLVIGDHVYFWNHETYDLINKKLGNAWRLENAVLIERQNGRDIFLGHGSGQKTSRQMHSKLAEEYNDVAQIALNLIRKLESARSAGTRAAALAEMGTRFPNIKQVGSEWRVQGQKFGRHHDMLLRLIQPSEVLGLKDPQNPSQMYPVRRPAESR